MGRMLVLHGSRFFNQSVAPLRLNVSISLFPRTHHLLSCKPQPEDRGAHALRVGFGWCSVVPGADLPCGGLSLLSATELDPPKGSAARRTEPQTTGGEGGTAVAAVRAMSLCPECVHLAPLSAHSDKAPPL